MKRLDPIEELQRAGLDGELDADGARRLRQAETLDPARAVEGAELSRLVEELGSLPEDIEPGRDLLPGILSRLPRESAPRRRGWLLAAALAATVGAAFLAGRGTVPERTDSDSTAAARVEQVSSVAAPGPASSLAAVSSSLVSTRLELRRAFEDSRADLPPETLALIEANLATIERAMAEIEAAIVADPGNRELGRMLVAYRTREIGLLKQAHTLATRL